MGIGVICSIAFWNTNERKVWLVYPALLVPIFWTIILSAGSNKEIDGIMDLFRLYDIETLLVKHQGRYAAALVIAPLFWSFTFCSFIWIELSIWKSWKETKEG